MASEINQSGEGEGEEALRETFHQQDCTICFEAFTGSEVLARLGCGHKFHEDCIVDWLERQLSCPVCRAPIQ